MPVRDLRDPLNPETRARLVEEVAHRSVQAVARELGVPRSAVTSILAGTAQRGTRALVALAAAQRWERQP